MNLLGVLEGVLFVVGDEGITLNQICEILNVDMEESKRLLMELKKTYETEDRGIRIGYLGDAFKLTTKKEHKEYYQRLIETPESNTLSPAALETLAIIAYNQPITRVEIDEMRGVNNVHMIRKLLAKGLIKEVGKSTMPGRPNLYGTTSEFLDYFGLSSIKELPLIVKEEEPTDNETELFTSIYKEEVKEEVEVNE
jgi:segregation and condensation protein B